MGEIYPNSFSRAENIGGDLHLRKILMGTFPRRTKTRVFMYNRASHFIRCLYLVQLKGQRTPTNCTSLEIRITRKGEG